MHLRLFSEPARGVLAATTLAALVAAPALLAQSPSPRREAGAPPNAAASLERLSEGVQKLSERVRPAVVQIATSAYAPATGAGLLTRQRGLGSGVILDPEGYIVTNAHVAQGARRVQVVLSPRTEAEGHSVLKARGRVLGAVVVGVDTETDLAVLKVEEKGLPFLPLGDSEALRQGQLVLAFGSPLGLENSATLGIVSSVARQLELDNPMIYIQTDASINPGNSGGPLVDIEGRVVGINTMILSQSGGNEGLGFAAPSNIVRTVYEQIKKTGRVRRGEIGARVQTITPTLAAGLGLAQDQGVIVSDVRRGSGAAAAGLGIGDVIVSLDGKPMENARQFNVNVYGHAVDTTVALEIDRGRKRLKLVVPVAERPGDLDKLGLMVSPERNLVPRLGVLGLDLDETLRALLPSLRGTAGVVVARAAGEGPLWEDPLEVGDVIYSLNGEAVTSVDALRVLLEELKPRAPVVLQVERGGQLLFVPVEIE
jgi:serine protease Do